jgi:hypothetical protein
VAGYRRQSTIYNLTFPDYDGLVVSIKGLTTGQMMKLWDDQALNAAAKAAGDKDAVSKATKEMLQMFVGALVEWNLEDDKGTPVPTTMEGIESLDLPFVLSLTEGWTIALAGADAELGKDSDSGSSFQEESIPMETS